MKLKIQASSLGAYIRTQRLAQGLTQAELGSRLGYSSQFVANWERGASSPPANILRQLIRELRAEEEAVLRILCEESNAYWRQVICGRTRSARAKR